MKLKEIACHLRRVLSDEAQKALLPHTGILCLHSNRSLPEFSVAMPRFPAPEIDWPIDETFHRKIALGITSNPAVHDGAIIAGYDAEEQLYRVLGWSFRLLPPPIETATYNNRGSAFHSSLAMSAVNGIDAVIFWSNGSLLVFDRGKIREDIF